MEKKLAILAYIPPSKVIGSQAFYDNITKFKTRHPLILYSDSDYPNTIKLRGSPEVLNNAKYPSGRPNPWSRNNLIFFTGLTIAKRSEFTHFIYIEADCRVGQDYWDDVIFKEAFKNGDPVAAGTIVIYNASNRSIEFTRAWNRFVAVNAAKRFPIPTYGGHGAAEKEEPRVFPNGAFGVYQVEWLLSKFDLTSCADLAAKVPAWDYAIGEELVKEFGDKVFDKIEHLESIYSGYGDVATTELERQELLTSGQVVGVHQIKSNWPGPGVIEAAAAVKEEVKPVRLKPKVGILIVTYLKDIEWLEYCLRSFQKFATGFDQVTIAIPRQGSAPLKKLAATYGVSVWVFDEVFGKGHLHQNAIKCMGDAIMPMMDYVAHIDSDCCFTEPVTPEDYFIDGKPVLVMEPYADIAEDNRRGWKPVTEMAVGFPVTYEFMCRHPAVHPKNLYYQTRKLVEKVTREEFLSFVLRQKSTFPYGFCEFNTLGAYAFENMHNAYHWIDVSKERRPRDKLIQFWSHATPDEELEFRFNGEKHKLIPRVFMDKLLERYKVS
jgi:hypothetical protein